MGTSQNPKSNVQSFVQFYREARRRKVFRTAALYLIGAWVTLQVADVLFPSFGIPGTALRALVWAAVLGFPIALVFGWLFDVGAEGIRRTRPVRAGEATAPQPLGPRDYALLGAFAVIGALLVLRAVQEVRQASVEPSGDVAGPHRTDEKRLPNSVAVLPFTNISSDPENEYFCDGISEEILNQISTVRTLNVIGRTSSFAFKGSSVGIDKISATLGVHYVLQGSVRKADRRLRISAQLLDERGRQLWAETFDRELTNVFDIQQEIAQAVVARVASEVGAQPRTASRPSLEAYDRYLAGRELVHRRNPAAAMAALERAIALDPGFADAHAEWAIARLIGSVSKEQLDAASAAIDRALALNPQSLRARAARGLWMLQSAPPDPAGAEATLRRVLQQDPNMSDALLWLSNALLDQGKGAESFEVLQRAARIDPLHPAIAGNLASSLSERGDVAGALDVLRRQLQQPNPGVGIYLQLLGFHRIHGQLVELNAVAKDFALHGAGQHYGLALSYALLGDDVADARWVEQSKKDYPDFVLNRYLTALLPIWRGDSERALEQIEQALRTAGKEFEDRRVVLQAWHGALLARSGHPAAAIEVLEPLVPAGFPPPQLGLNVAPQLDVLHALAWAYQGTGQADRAVRLLDDMLERCRTTVENSRYAVASDELHYCAESAVMAGETDRALALLERAVAAGWRDYYIRRNDPYWARLEGDPRYRTLMSKVQEDIARQRAQVARVDATDDFVARLDAALATQPDTSVSTAR